MVKRGQVWWAELDERTASEPGFRRPVIIVQSDDFNRSRIRTVIVVAVTSNLKLAQAPGNVSLPRSKTGLAKDSVANVSQIITLDKQYLSEELCSLGHTTMRQIDDGIRLALSI